MNNSSGRFFGDDYYNVCSSQSDKINFRWFCNKPLEPIQDVNKENEVDSSSESIFRNQDLSDESFKDFSNSSDDPDYIPSPTSENETQEKSDSFEYINNSLISHEKNISSTDLSHNLDINSAEATTQEQSILKLSEKATSVNKDIALSLSCSADNIKKKSREKDFCYFCEDFVLNFARHLNRNHSSEIEVQKICSLRANSRERKQLISAIRKKGNFLTNNENGKPIKKSSLHKNFLPCSNCYGFYSSKTLWRHRKACVKDKASGSQADAQSFIVRNLKIDEQLRQSVFPRMRADEISLVAKKDMLICSFAARYIKIHREKHFITVASRKMRELARLLIELRKLDSTIKNLFAALKPECYDNFVKATKRVAKYDEEKEFYNSPTYAMNMGTTLKQFILKKRDVFGNISSAEKEADVKTLITLIESHWKFDISSQASNDLYTNRWNKVTLLPLASDLKLLKDHLMLKANAAEEKLNSNLDETAYIVLLETIFCRLILLNRRRPGELQRLLLRTYNLETENKQCYEEFNEVVTQTEKILMQRFKRIIIRGKRGRGVPVLFSDDVQRHLSVILKYRDNFIKKENLFLFGNLKSTEPICGYKVLKKYATNCGAKNPVAITCTRLRKHLATLTQIFNMSDSDLEQLATFMGHTIGTHRQAYRLPDDIYQTAKISKLLLLMEKGEAGPFKGKSLDEIEVDMNDDLMDTAVNKDDEEDLEYDSTNEDEDKGCKETMKKIKNSSSSSSSSVKNKRLKSNLLKYGKPQNDMESVRETEEEDKGQDNIENKKINRRPKRQLVPWTPEQKTIVESYFKQHIKNHKPPKRFECEELIKKNPNILNNKSWLKIKVFVQNKYTKKS